MVIFVIFFSNICHDVSFSEEVYYTCALYFATCVCIKLNFLQKMHYLHIFVSIIVERNFVIL